MTVGALDLGILFAYLLVVVLLGLWIGRGARSVTDYMVAGRNLPWWVILASIIATETSTVTFLSIPGFAYSRDMTWLQIPLGFLIGRFLVAWILVPQYFRGSLFTAYEVLDERFGGATKQAASVLFVLTRTLADGLRLFLTAIVLQEMTTIPLWLSVVVLGLATIVYTYLGGMRSVVWTDFLQFLLYMTGALVAFWVLLRRLPGGWDQMIEIGDAAGRLRVFDLGWDLTNAYGLWAGLLGGLFVTLGSHGVDQMMVQRYLCARRLADARRALWVGGFVIVAQFALFLLIGVGLFAFYELFPPEVAFERPDRVFARFLLDEMPVGLLGLLLGAVFAAAMSTLSSSLNSCATAVTNDLYRDRLGDSATPESLLRLTRRWTIVFGLAQIGVGIGGQWVQASVVSSVLGIAAFTTGIVLGVFFLGLWADRVGQRAALVGLVCGLVGMTFVFFGTPLAWPWYALVGSLGTFAIGWGASYWFPRERPGLG